MSCLKSPLNIRIIKVDFKTLTSFFEHCAILGVPLFYSQIHSQCHQWLYLHAAVVEDLIHTLISLTFQYKSFSVYTAECRWWSFKRYVKRPRPWTKETTEKGYECATLGHVLLCIWTKYQICQNPIRWYEPTWSIILIGWLIIGNRKTVLKESTSNRSSWDSCFRV